MQVEQLGLELVVVRVQLLYSYCERYYKYYVLLLCLQLYFDVQVQVALEQQMQNDFFLVVSLFEVFLQQALFHKVNGTLARCEGQELGNSFIGECESGEEFKYYFFEERDEDVDVLEGGLAF